MLLLPQLRAARLLSSLLTTLLLQKSKEKYRLSVRSEAVAVATNSNSNSNLHRHRHDAAVDNKK